MSARTPGQIACAHNILSAAIGTVVIAMEMVNYALAIKSARPGETGWPVFHVAAGHPIMGYLGEVGSLDEAIQICHEGGILRMEIDQLAHEQMVLAGTAPLEPRSTTVMISIVTPDRPG